LFLMIVNTVAASAAPFVALLASALETGHRVATTDVAKGPARFPTAAFRTKRKESPTQHDRGAAQGTFSLVERSAASGRVRNDNDAPDGELLRRMT
jgi:hypothetical protein